jgi:cell shape-determining protein MreD
MTFFWTAAAIVGALLAQTVLSLLVPGYARVFDPFLLVLVYCGLTGGASRAMLAGAAAGWVQDVHFGGPVLGLSGLTKVLVGFGVGAGSTRFHLAEPGPRVLVLLLATVVDAVVFNRLAAVFDVSAYALSPLGLLVRAGTNAVVGILAFEAIDRRRNPHSRREL